MTKLKTYSGHAGSHTGSSGFTNHFTGGPICQAKALARVFKDFPDAVVLNGQDNFEAPIVARAPALCARFEITPLAYFHTGISGIAKSGVVLSREDYARFQEAMKTTELTFKEQVPERDGLGGYRRVTKEVTQRGNNYRGNVYMLNEDGYCHGLRGGRTNDLEVLGRKYTVKWKVNVEDGSVEWSLDNNHGTTYLLKNVGNGILVLVNKRTGRPPSSKLCRVRFVDKGEYVAVAGTAGAKQKQGWHGDVFYG